MQSTGFCISGRVESGFVQREDKVLVSPLNQLATVRSVLTSEELTVNTAFAGDQVSLVLQGPEMNSVANGMVVCDPSLPIPVTKNIRSGRVLFY